MFRLLAREVPCAELHEVRRFDAAWEAGASVRLRAGDFTAYADYDRHGRMRGADQDAAMDRAAGHVAGRPPARQERPAARRVQQRGRRAVPPGPGQADPARHRPAAAGRAGRRQPGRDRRPDPGPAQHQDQRGRPGADQPRHAEDHRLARAACPGTAAGARRDLDQPVPDPPRVPGGQRRAGLRGQHPRRARPHRGHRPPAGHRHPVPPVPVRRADQGPGVQHRAHRHREHRATRPPALPAGLPGIGGQGHPGTRRRGPVGHRADPPRPGPDRRNRPPAHPVVRRGPAVAVPADRRSRSKPGSPNPKPGDTTGSTPAQSSSSGCAPPSSPGTTSARSSARSPPRRWTAPGPSPASCTAASSSSSYPTSATT